MLPFQKHNRYSLNDTKYNRIRFKINRAVERFTTAKCLGEQKKAAWWLSKWQIYKLEKMDQ